MTTRNFRKCFKLARVWFEHGLKRVENKRAEFISDVKRRDANSARVNDAYSALRDARAKLKDVFRLQIVIDFRGPRNEKGGQTSGRNGLRFARII